jgi:hypothetical protein
LHRRREARISPPPRGVLAEALAEFPPTWVEGVWSGRFWLS